MSPPAPAPALRRSVVSSFLSTGPPAHPTFRISIFKRSPHVRVYKNLWAACSGSIEPTHRTPLAAALREIAEETSLPAAAVTLLRAGEAYEIFDAEIGIDRTIYPFLFRVDAEEGGRRRRRRIGWTGAEARGTGLGSSGGEVREGGGGGGVRDGGAFGAES